MVDFNRKFDVLVIGGGNAALCAAISARRAGASVLVLEGAPKFYRGGNTRDWLKVKPPEVRARQDEAIREGFERASRRRGVKV